MEDRNTILKLFGFEIVKPKKQEKKEEKTVSVIPTIDEDDGTSIRSTGAAHYGQAINFDIENIKNNAELIRQYRAAANYPEVDKAIENIISEAIVTSENEPPVFLTLDDLKFSTNVKKKITEEFDNILMMLNFNNFGYDIFKKWYVDGRLYYHLVVEKGREKEGIQEIRPIDATKIQKVREVVERVDKETGVKVYNETDVLEYFIYQENVGNQQTAVKLTTDSVSYITSGLLSEDRTKVISHLHKSLKTINQLKMMEDSLVIYRLARAPERRVFYVDVGNLPRGKAEEYLQSIIAKYRNKIVYDPKTGTVKDDRKHMSMLEDFWLPRREGGRGTEIDTLGGGENLGQIDDIVFFLKKLYNSLNVPVKRLDPETNTFQIGRDTEISRDELQFQRFVDRLRNRFSNLFLSILKTQLILKGIITEEDWDQNFVDIIVDYARDNFFAEMKDAEILRERLDTADRVLQYIGTYFSREWVQKNVFRFSDDDIKEMKKQIEDERSEDKKNGLVGDREEIDFGDQNGPPQGGFQ